MIRITIFKQSEIVNSQFQETEFCLESELGQDTLRARGAGGGRNPFVSGTPETFETSWKIPCELSAICTLFPYPSPA